MINIKVAQHIYGNVEQEFSPTKQGGFQTLFFTQSLLSKAESGEVEDKLLYYQSESNPVKRVFFMLENGKAVVSRILQMTGKDKFGREGSYLAHSVILEENDFLMLENNPFIIFEVCETSFVGDLASALKKGDKKSQDFKELSLKIDSKRIAAINEKCIEGMRKWGGGNLKKLALYTIDYERLKREKEPLVFSGSDQQMKETIGMLFMFLPTAQRTGLSFDTHFTGCNLVHSDYWGIGFPEITGSYASMATVDCNTRKLNLNMQIELSPYKLWVLDNISRGSFNDIFSYSTLAFQVQELVLKQSCDERLIRAALAEQGNTSLKSITDVYKETIISRTTQEFKTMVGKSLSGYLLPQLVSQDNVGKQSIFLYNAFLDGFGIDSMADDLYEIFKKRGKNAPPKQDIKELKTLLKKIKHERLSRMLTLWDKDYAELVEHAVAIPQDGDSEAVTVHNATVEVLNSVFPQLKLKELRRIKKLADEKEEKLPERLGKALDKAIFNLEKLIKPSKLKRFFKKVITKFKPGKKKEKE